jgi:hypothetical protein
MLQFPKKIMVARFKNEFPLYLMTFENPPVKIKIKRRRFLDIALVEISLFRIVYLKTRQGLKHEIHTNTGHTL